MDRGARSKFGDHAHSTIPIVHGLIQIQQISMQSAFNRQECLLIAIVENGAG